MRIELAAEAGRHLQRLDRLSRRRDTLLGLTLGGGIVLEEVEQLPCLGKPPGSAVDGGTLVAQLGELLHDALRRIRVVPELLRVRTRVELCYPPPFRGIVKDAP